MRFEWDENKRRINVETHGIDFVGIADLYESETYSVIDERFDYGETRYYTVGFLNGEVLAVSHTEEDEVLRIISVRKLPGMKKKHILEKSETDWERLRNMKDEDIDLSDIPPITDEMWAKGILRKNFKPIPRKRQLTLRIDDDVIDFFKEQGRGYQTRINQLLRAYMEAHRTNLTSK